MEIWPIPTIPLENADEMFVLEMWETLNDLENHINMPHYVAFDDRRPLAQMYQASSTNGAPRSN